jgi:hypothetical protein
VGHLDVGATQKGCSQTTQRRSLWYNCCIGSAQAGHLDVGAVVDVSYVAPQAHRIINVALHQKYSPSTVFIFS